MKKGILSADWLVGLVVCLVFAFLAWSGNAVLQSLERYAYDLGVSGTSRDPSDKIAIVAIDDESIANIGRWPWPRNIHAEMIDTLSQAGAKVVGNLVFYSEPQTDAGLAYIDLINDVYKESGYNINELDEIISLARQDLDTDANLSASIGKAANVVLPMTFVLGETLGNADEKLPDFISRNFVSRDGGGVTDNIEAEINGMLPFPAIIPDTPPIETIGQNSLAIGHLNTAWDVDGGNRRDPLVLSYYNDFVPSFALQVAARSLNLTPKDISIKLGESLQLGRLTIKTDPFLLMNTFYYTDKDDRPAFPVDSFFDVREGKINADKYKNKIVLIGSTAIGVGTPQKTPVNSAMMPVISMAHTISSILEEDFFVVPSWATWAELAVFLLIAVYLIVLVPRMKAGPAALVTVVLAIVMVAVSYGLMTTQALWLQLITPTALLVIGHMVLTTKRFLITERGKERSDFESAESNRMLGLAYQGKGDLDTAFASFRKVTPVDDALLDLVYNLALDFERKRQFNKAVFVYQFIGEHNPKFRDIETRMNRSKNLEETVLLGGAGGGGTAQGTMLLDGGGVTKPMLGRYEVEKELGKGAMGIVYLGKDPKINRVVAIKTMALSQEFEADEVDEVKERFFREAETAGRLNHPNIVTIFDAGEEHDLAYIAMEFLKGADLAGHTKGDNLLDIKTVLDVIIKSADALDYAHSQNVVHRDIKPANIMYEPDTKQVKLTDFGIARITDSSKTKTGMVLGTPSYMSPEQLSGKKVDGRSDLFSLGVMLYQMLTGKLPFTGDSMATLMFKIANEPHLDLNELRPDLPASLGTIIDKALHKSANDRYSRGAQMAEDLRASLSSLNA